MAEGAPAGDPRLRRSGWVQNWRKQHGLKSYKKIDGEKGSADFNGATFGRSACHMILYNVQRFFQK